MDTPLLGVLKSLTGQLFNSPARAKQLNPNLSYQLMKFRSAPDDFCEEAIVLKK